MGRREPHVEHVRFVVNHEWRDYWLGRWGGDLSIHHTQCEAQRWVKKRAGC